jgi:hypothetical protein
VDCCLTSRMVEETILFMPGLTVHWRLFYRKPS